MKRSAPPARYRAAKKAQENPHGALVVFFFFLLLCLLSARNARASFEGANNQFAFEEFSKRVKQ